MKHLKISKYIRKKIQKKKKILIGYPKKCGDIAAGILNAASDAERTFKYTQL